MIHRLETANHSIIQGKLSICYLKFLIISTRQYVNSRCEGNENRFVTEE